MRNERKINVALVIPSLCYGGAERQVAEIARNLDGEKFNCHLILFEDYAPTLPENDPLRDKIIIVARRSKFDLTLFYRLAKELKRLNIDVVHGFLFLAEISARLAAPIAGVKTIIGSERNSHYKPAWHRWLLIKLTNPLCSCIVANSQSGANFNQALYRFHKSRYRILYNGVDADKFQPGDRKQAKRYLNIPEDTQLIGMFAGFKRQKNHTFLLRAFKIVLESKPQAKLLLVGDTLFADHDGTQDYKAGIVREMKDLGIEDATIVLGNRPDVEKVYPACTITVLPSLHEGTPNVVLESMASGVPAIVSNVSDNSVIVTQGQDGYVVELGDVEQLANKILELLDSPETQTTMARQARATALGRFSMQAMAGSASNIYIEHTNIL